MKITFIVALLVATNTFAQWTYKTVDNNFDEPFKKALNVDKESAGIIILEQSDYNFDMGFKVPLLAIRGAYFCEDTPDVDFVFFVNGIKQSYDLRGSTSTDREYLFFDDEVWTSDFIKSFKSASKLLVRVNQYNCDNDYYEFNFGNSTNAFNFIIK